MEISNLIITKKEKAFYIFQRFFYKFVFSFVYYVLDYIFPNSFFKFISKKVNAIIEKDSVKLLNLFLFFNQSNDILGYIKDKVIRYGKINCYKVLILRSISLNGGKYEWSSGELNSICESVAYDDLICLIFSLFNYLDQEIYNKYALDWNFRQEHRKPTIVDVVVHYQKNGGLKSSTFCSVANPIEVLVKKNKLDAVEYSLINLPKTHWIFKNINAFLVFKLLESNDGLNCAIEFFKKGIFDFKVLSTQFKDSVFLNECNKIINSVNLYTELKRDCSIKKQSQKIIKI